MDGMDQLGASSSLRGRQQGGVRRLSSASLEGSPERDLLIEVDEALAKTNENLQAKLTLGSD